ncbi:MAG: hypothetical protein EU541_02605 [Promethearchaeota archaeon]|nr:MAG: hypothetical protein EU541_02605 [Candidatus Lokiarchaeota archaeon]
MPHNKRLNLVFLIIYIAVFLYIMLFLLVPPFQDFIIDMRTSLSTITEGGNYFWALLISFGICFLGSASIGFPVPFPVVLFTLSNSVYIKYENLGLVVEQIIMSGNFWFEILGLAIIGGLGAACGELTGYVLGWGAKKIEETRDLESLKNLNGFSRLILKNESRTPFYVFLFALTPLPDDILFIPIGMRKYPLWKTLIPAWLGKNVTTLLYCCWPLFLEAGLIATGLESNDTSTIITEAVILLFTITVMYFIFSFNWDRYATNLEKKRQARKE